MALNRFLRSLDWRSSGKWTLLSITVGVIAGLGGVAFVFMTQWISHSTLYEFSGYLPGEAAGEHSMFGHALVDVDPWRLLAVMTLGGMGYAREFHVERYLREAWIPRLAPVSAQLILSFIAEKVLDLPKSY